MSKLSEIFKERKALITFITAGDPNLAKTEKLIFLLEKAGADIIELGIPFSDPLADGPIIQASHLRALKNKVTLAQVFSLAAKVRKKTRIPLCFMLSYNLVLQFGVERFYQQAARVGVDGVIIPDLPPEEPVLHGMLPLISTIYLAAPTSTEERLRLITEKSSGFIYLISSAGITGKKGGLAENLPAIIRRIHLFTDLPVAVGFGISSPTQAKEAAEIADGVIVGSAIVDLIAKKKFKTIPRFVAALRRALDAVR